MEFIKVGAGSTGPPTGEESMDVEWASGMAPDAHVRVYAATSLNDTDLEACYARIVSDMPTQPGLCQVSCSYCIGEGAGASILDTDDQYFTSMAAGGITVFCL